ncbi:MAG: glycosyltransferase family 4 protein [Chloroflexota bacterium]
MASQPGKRILFLTPQVPYPPEQGTAIRNYNLIAQVATRHQAGLLTFGPDTGAEAASLGPLNALCAPLRVVPVPARSTGARLRTLLTSGQPDMAERLASPAFAGALRETLSAQPWDILQVEGIEMAPYGLLAQAWLGERAPAVVFDDHNAEYVLQQRAFATDLARPRRWPMAAYSWAQWRRLRRFERQVCQRAQGVACVSEADARALRRLCPGLAPLVVTNGVDTARYHPALADSLPLRHPSVVFTGKMDFRPNIDAMLWFHAAVWPLVRAGAPGAQLYVVGKSPHARLAPLAEDASVTLTGYVEDILPYFGGADVYVVPLRVGGGTRLKVLEALAAGRAIVTTALGAEGIALRPGEHALVADSPADFGRAILALLADPAQRARLGAAARRLAVDEYDWRAIAPLLEPLYARL